jgi:hypothetical protein
LVLADIANVEIAGGSVEAVPERVAQAEREDLVGAGGPDEHVVGGNDCAYSPLVSANKILDKFDAFPRGRAGCETS